jgi:hypothetical protein
MLGDQEILRAEGSGFVLQLGASVGVDFAVKANFLKNRCCPLHDDDPQ